jgi:hypothetical protein
MPKSERQFEVERVILNIINHEARYIDKHEIARRVHWRANRYDMTDNEINNALRRLERGEYLLTRIKQRGVSLIVRHEFAVLGATKLGRLFTSRKG